MIIIAKMITSRFLFSIYIFYLNTKLSLINQNTQLISIYSSFPKGFTSHHIFQRTERKNMFFLSSLVSVHFPKLWMGFLLPNFKQINQFLETLIVSSTTKCTADLLKQHQSSNCLLFNIYVSRGINRPTVLLCSYKNDNCRLGLGHQRASELVS